MTAAAILRLHEVRKRFGKTEIIRGANLDIAEGEIHALIGPNGAGKSTVFHLISGRLAPDSGTISYFGENIAGLRPALIARRGISRSFQQTSAFPTLTVAENLVVAAMARSSERGSITKTTAAMRAAWSRAEELLALLGLEQRAAEAAGALAYADARALEIGLAIAPDPRLVLLDEPTAGMSRAETDATMAAIRRLAKGRTLVLVEHDMNVVYALANRVSVLVYGEVIVTAAPSIVREDPRVQSAYLGRSLPAAGVP